jgi:hypothetical protein
LQHAPRALAQRPALLSRIGPSGEREMSIATQRKQRFSRSDRLSSLTLPSIKKKSCHRQYRSIAFLPESFSPASASHPGTLQRLVQRACLPGPGRFSAKTFHVTEHALERRDQIYSFEPSQCLEGRYRHHHVIQAGRRLGALRISP